MNRGALRVTASYDLNVDQLMDLLDATPPEWLEVVIHQQIPMFHMEHCVYLCVPVAGNRRDQLRPAVRPSRREAARSRRHGASPQGRRRLSEHALQRRAADGGRVPAAADRSRSAGHLRIEFLDEDARPVERIIGLYQAVLAGAREAKTLWRELKASNQYGVTRGPLNVL